MNLMIKYDIEVSPDESEVAEMFKNGEIMQIAEGLAPPEGWSVISNFTKSLHVTPIRDQEGRFIAMRFKHRSYNPNKLPVFKERRKK